MRKIFTLFAAMLFAVTINAAIDPGTDQLDDAISNAEGVLELASGDFIETSSIGISEDIVIKAANGATPVIKAKGFGIQNGARVTFEGIKFDASAVTSHLIYANDGSDGNELILKGCEIYGFDINSSLIHCSSSEKLDSIIIDDCYVHNIKKSFIFHEGESLKGLNVTNSTIANITTVAGSYYASIINPLATDVKVKVDNCTFYNCNGMASDHGAIRVPNATNVTVSNCIFMMPESYAGRAVMIKGGNVKNCLLHNFTKGTKGIHTDSPWAPTITACIDDDPLFAEAANADYTLDEENSPAKGAGVGGTHLGDPYWWPASWQPATIIPVSEIDLNVAELEIEVDDITILTATVSPDNATDKTVTWTSSNESVAKVSANGLVSAIAEGTAIITATAGEESDVCEVTVIAASVPSTNFSEALILSGKKAHLEGAIWKNEAYKLYGIGGSNKQYGNAYWTIHVTQPCVVTGTLNGVEGGHMFALDLYQGNDSIGTIAQRKAKDWSAGNIAMDSVGYSTLTFPAAGDYTLKLRNTQEWSSGKVAGITLTKEYDLIDIYLKAGVWDAEKPKFGVYVREEGWWPEFMENVENDLYVFRNFPANKIYLNFVRFNNTADAPSDTYKWNDVVNKTRENDNNYFKITGWETTDGEWRKYFPGFVDGYYLVGTHNSWEPTAADIMDENVSGGYKKIKDVAEGDQFKAIRIDAEGLNAGWYPDGSGNEYTIPSELAGNVTINFKPNGDDSWSDANGGGKKFYVVKNSGTAIDNTVAGEKAVKVLRNGQLFIEKDGKTYNVLGTMVK